MLKISPIFAFFKEKKIENWLNQQKFKEIALLFYKIKQKELENLIADYNEIEILMSFFSYLKTYNKLDYFYVLHKEDKMFGVLSFDINEGDLYFKKGKYMIFTQTGVIGGLNEFWFLLKQFKIKTKEIIEIEKPDFYISYLKNVKHNDRLFSWFIKAYNLKTKLHYNLKFVGE